MTTPFFTVTSDGLTATVDALSQIVAGVTSYFTATARGIAVPVPVFAGDWEQWRNTSDGPPGRVIIAQGDFEILEAGDDKVWANGVRYAPGDMIDLDATHRVPVRGIRAQMFKVWVLGINNKGQTFATDAPGSLLAVAQSTSAFALADLTFAALRDIHGHPLGKSSWTPMGAERGELAYGAVLVGGFGPIPIPVLGDIVTTITPTQAQSTNLVLPATTGDTVTAP